MKKFCAWLLLLIMACTMTGVAEEEMNHKYRSLGENLYRLGDAGYIIEHWKNFIGDDYLIRNISRNAQQYNTCIPLDGNVKKYVFFIESPCCVNLASDLSGENEIYVKIRSKFETTATATLALDHYTDYTRWFHMTDHHWNHIGAYKAYCDIIDMMFSNSCADAIKLLLLQRYDAIYAIDPRFYEKEMGKKFNAQKYIEKHEIDDVLILGDVQFFIRTFGLSGR